MSGDDGLREALAVWLADTYESAYQYATVEPDFDWDVDGLLALPEVAALRAKAAAADRVRELAEEEERWCDEMQNAEIRVAVPMKAGRDFLDRLFDVIGDAAYDAQPEDREGWDVFVSASMPETPQVPTHLIRRALDGDGSRAAQEHACRARGGCVGPCVGHAQDKASRTK